MEIVSNDAINYSVILNRSLSVKIDGNTEVKVDIEIFVFKDDDDNLKITTNTHYINNVVHCSKRIASYAGIDNFIKEYKKKNKIDIFNFVEDSIKKYYKNYKNQQIKELAKEHNVNL